jgi:hypothetical protein
MASLAGTGMAHAGAISAARRPSARVVSGFCLPAMMASRVTGAKE